MPSKEKPALSVAAKKRERAQKKVAETKARSDANPRGPKRLAAMFPMGEQRGRSAAAKAAHDKARGFETIRDEDGRTGVRVSPNGGRKAADSGPLQHAAWPKLDPEGVEWGSEEFGALVAKMNETMTVKQICVELGFDNTSPYWRKVSLAMRSYKDTHGVARPGRRSEKPVAAPTGRGKEQAVKPKKSEHATRRVTLTEMSDEEITAAIEGRWVTYNFASTTGQDEAFIARVMKFDHGIMARGDLGMQTVITFIDHVSPPGKAEVKAAMEENREPKEHADGVTRSLYVSQIVAIGRKG